MFLLQTLAPVLPHRRQADVANRLAPGLEGVARALALFLEPDAVFVKQLFEDPFALRPRGGLRSLEPTRRIFGACLLYTSRCV